MGNLKKIKFGLVVALGLSLGACNGIGMTPDVSIAPNQVVAAASAFDALELAATVYISSPNRDRVATTKIIIAMRTARHARDNLEAAVGSGSSSVSALRAFTIASNTLRNILTQYGVAGV